MPGIRKQSSPQASRPVSRVVPASTCWPLLDDGEVRLGYDLSVKDEEYLVASVEDPGELELSLPEFADLDGGPKHIIRIGFRPGPNDTVEGHAGAIIRNLHQDLVPPEDIVFRVHPGDLPLCV